MVKNKIIGIYKIISPSGKIYIGQSCDIHKRWKHEYFKLHCKQQVKLYNSFLKYGVENHTFEIIHILKDDNLCKSEIIKELNRLESYYIKEFNSFFDDNKLGLNLTRGGDSFEISNETKKKMSDSKKGIIFSETHLDNLRKSHLGQIAWNKGLKMPEEQRIRMSGENNPMFGKKGDLCFNYGKKRTPEQNQKNRERNIGENNPNYGKPTWNKNIKYTEEQKKNLRKPKPKSAEHIKNNAIARTGKKREGQALLNIIEAQRKRRERELQIGFKAEKRVVSDETRKKQSLARLGKKLTPESIEKREETKKLIKQERLSMIF